MRGFHSSSYGDGFADVYDDWYADVTDVDATVAHIAGLAGPNGSVLELGVGTGRLAIPMAEAGLRVTGIDSSEAMLERLRTRAGEGVQSILGDMVEDLPDGPFDAALVAYNTIFNLLDPEVQAACFRAVAARLSTGGRFVVEAFVPDDEATADPDVSVRSMAADHVVLSVSQTDPGAQRASGQFVEISESGGVRLRPWSIRWATPAQLDEMAAAAGLDLESRTEDMSGTAFTDDSKTHVTTYQKH